MLVYTVYLTLHVSLSIPLVLFISLHLLHSVQLLDTTCPLSAVMLDSHLSQIHVSPEPCTAISICPIRMGSYLLGSSIRALLWPHLGNPPMTLDLLSQVHPTMHPPPPPSNSNPGLRIKVCKIRENIPKNWPIVLGTWAPLSGPSIPSTALRRAPVHTLHTIQDLPISLTSRIMPTSLLSLKVPGLALLSTEKQPLSRFRL